MKIILPRGIVWTDFQSSLKKARLHFSGYGEAKEGKMSWPKLLVLVRHAESEGNIKSVDERAEYEVATQNYELTARGRKQAQITGEYLRETFGYFDIYYVSYYVRSRQTMEIIYPGVKVYEDPRLAEAQRGIWQTMTRQQIQNRFPEEFERKTREGLYHYRPLGGENWPDVELRIHSFLGTLSRDCAGKKVIAVVHGHWLILFERLIYHFSIEEALFRYNHRHAENASVAVYEGVEERERSRMVLEKENIIPWKENIDY